MHYRDAQHDRGGLGLLGFGERIVTVPGANIGTATFYDNDTDKDNTQRIARQWVGADGAHHPQTKAQWHMRRVYVTVGNARNIVDACSSDGHAKIA